jgi:phosphohistidine swiveling domain-containing protein
MPNIIPVDEYVTEEWYPGFKPEYGYTFWATEAVDTFSKKDEERFWFLDFHWPRGLSPMGLIFLHDCYSWGTQLAAQGLPLPPGKGIVQRLGGTHVYASEVPVGSDWEIGFRAQRIGRNLPSYLQRFPDIWADRVWELETGLQYFETYETSGKQLSDLAQLLVDARAFHCRAWEIHFEVMYPLLANYLGFYGVCAELGVDPGQISKFLQGYDTKILECDRELWKLTAAAREAGLEAVFAANDAEKLHDTLAGTPEAAGWLKQFGDFLHVYGWRTEGISDINLAPWIEDPVSPLGTVKTFLQRGELFDFDAARQAAHDERDTAIDEARSRLTKEEQAKFDAALSSCQHANFAWWNDEHNHYIDLRATIPMRRACLAIGDALGADRADDTTFAFWPELMAVVHGERTWDSMKSIVQARREYYDHWQAKRPEMPKVLGTIPEEVTDPILIEIFGMHHHFFEAMKAGPGVTTLTGVAASAGVVRGKARVLHGAGELHRILPGEILVCEATSPNWTPAFAKIAACVCDGGGTLTHASIVSREYRIPCVVGVGLATTIIADGDEVEVDGTKGTVTVFKAD